MDEDDNGKFRPERVKQDFQMLIQNKTNMSNFHPLGVVDRGSETQLQVDENLKV